MAPFTPVATDVDWWQKVEYVNEILLGYKQRRIAVGGWYLWTAEGTWHNAGTVYVHDGKAYKCLVTHISTDWGTDWGLGMWEEHMVAQTGGDAQDGSWWLEIQRWLIGAGTLFVDDTLPIDGYYVDNNQIRIFTSQKYLYLSGLKESETTDWSTGWGFRRAKAWYPKDVKPGWTDDWTDPEDPMWTTAGIHNGGRGYIDTFYQPNDIIGPWIFEDIQNCLSTLKWTKTWVTSRATMSENRGVYETDWDCATALGLANAAWPPAATKSFFQYLFVRSLQDRAPCLATATKDRISVAATPRKVDGVNGTYANYWWPRVMARAGDTLTVEKTALFDGYTLTDKTFFEFLDGVAFVSGAECQTALPELDLTTLPHNVDVPETGTMTCASLGTEQVSVNHMESRFVWKWDFTNE